MFTFELSQRDGQTEVRFTHLGPIPSFGCCNKYSSAWSFYANGSLRKLITTGQGEPNAEGGAVVQLLTIPT